MVEITGDLRYAVRWLLRNRGFALVAVATLALAVGANAALYSVVSGVLLRSLPYRDADRLAIVWHHDTNEGEPRSPLSPVTLVDLRERTETFAALAGIGPEWDFTVEVDDGPERLSGFFASADFFPLLGVEPLRGRWLLPEEDQPGALPVAVLSARLAERLLGADARLDDAAVLIDGVSTTVVGVMPASFRFLEDADLWLPASRDPLLQRFASRLRSVRWVTVLGQLAPGVTRAQAQAEMTALMGRLEREHPDTNAGLAANVTPLIDEVVGDVRPALLMLWGTVGFVLLIACVNVANLLLSRSWARRTEMAVRRALGAGRGRLVKQLAIESLLLALLGGAASLPLAFWTVELLRSVAPADFPRLDEVGLDTHVLLFTLGICVLIALLFGLAPAWQLGRDEHGQLGHGARTAGGRSRLGRALVVAEVAMALILLVGAGLLIRSFASVMRVDPGFNPDNVLTMQISLPSQRYPEDPQRTAFYDQLFERLEGLPDIVRAGGGTRLPLGSGVTTSLEIATQPREPADRPQIQTRRATPGYFSALGIPLRRGRVFDDRDGADARLVAVVNETAARRFWPGEDPLGARIQFGGASSQTWWTIVGVVGDVRHFGLDAAARPEVYTAFAQGPPSSPFLAIRTLSDPFGVVASVRDVIRGLDREVTVQEITSMHQALDRSLASRRFNLWLIGLFAALSLTLAGVGLYGVMSHAVTQRTREIGIRIALGARPGQTSWLIVGQGMGLTALGLVLGMGGALALTRFIDSLLFGVSAADPLTMVATAVVLCGVALLACASPSWRATRVDPVRALRHE